MTLPAELLADIPNDDPEYLNQVARNEAEGMHPAVAAIQAEWDLHTIAGNTRPRNEHGNWTPQRKAH